MYEEGIRETRFDNGLVVLTDRMAGVRSATLGFFFRVGSRHEPDDLYGISHFIEHTVFKGTRKRTALDIAIEQERLGGNLDAFTTHEETGFAIKVIDDQLPAAFDLIADMLTTPRFDDDDLKAEQRVIVEEMKMIDDNPEEYLGEVFSEAFFPGHPLGRSIAGTPSTVRTFGHAKTRMYHQDVFNPANLVIAAAGNVEHERLVDLAAAAFAGTAASGRQIGCQDGGVPVAAAPIFVKHRSDLEQAHLIIATPFVSAVDERRYAADLLSGILGGGTASRLWQKVREERGLAYSVGASAAMYQDCGVFTIFAGTSPGQVLDVVGLSMTEVRDVCANGVRDDELALAKQQARASILLSLEDSASRAAAIAQSEMVHGRQIPVEETLARIDAVTGPDCHSVAREFFRSELVAFAAIGDLRESEISREHLTVS